jgi:hypothetical protein
MQCAISGFATNPTVIGAAQAGPQGIAADATNVYWGNATGGNLVKCSVSGCAPNPTTIAFGLANGAPVIAVDATNVYWIEPSNLTASIETCPIAGCGDHPATLVSGQILPNALAVDATSVYWTDQDSDAVMKIAK